MDATAEQDAYHELCAYTLAHGDLSFIHQHVVDAYAVQRADESTKPIALTFGLVGLYLKIERQFTGRQVQRAHMALARRKQVWPAFALPRDRGAATPRTVMAAPAGPERDEAIDAWCRSVWDAFQANRATVVALLEQHGLIEPSDRPRRSMK
jgi:uncharacterized protein DUF5946